MNEQFNPFRTVPREEVESVHTFRSLRHFPEISKSIPNATACIETRTLETPALNKTVPKKKKTKKNALKSTHYLESLCKSSLNEFSTLSTFRKQIINDREKPHSHATTMLASSFPKKNEKADPLETGNAKLTKFAIKHDSRRANNDLEGFNGFALSKEEFDYQLKRCLTIYLTRDELDAVFTYIDTDCSNYIDGVEFLRYFFKLGQDARDKVRANLIETAAQAQAKKEKKEEEERRRVEEANLSLKTEFTNEDLESAMQKLCHFVGKTNITLDCIEFRDMVAFLTPLEFKLHMEKLTNSRFSEKEAAALLEKYGDAVPPKQRKNGVWCYVDSSLLIKSLIELRKLELIKIKERAMANSQCRDKVKQMLGTGVDLFPKCLGR